MVCEALCVLECRFYVIVKKQQIWKRPYLTLISKPAWKAVSYLKENVTYRLSRAHSSARLYSGIAYSITINREFVSNGTVKSKCLISPHPHVSCGEE